MSLSYLASQGLQILTKSLRRGLMDYTLLHQAEEQAEGLVLSSMPGCL